MGLGARSSCSAVWQASAFAIIIYLSGLQTIPQELYEAASIDGAKPWRQFRSITFPLISAFFTINMVLSLKGFLQVFDHIVALTNGGPGTATESITLLIYRGGFTGRRVRVPDRERGDLRDRDHRGVALPVPGPPA